MTTSLAFEIFITVIVVGIQVIYFRSTLKKIRKVELFFPAIAFDHTFIKQTLVQEDSVELIKYDDPRFRKDFLSVINDINKYLLKNKGTADFSIIKSIVERNIESRENFVSSNISLPLYIGLLGTFTGIIVGLINIAFFGGVTDNNINAFIGGVVVAMVGSFCGLLFTIISNSHHFKRAKAICDERKNIFYNFLSVELLPHLGNNLFEALDRFKVNINDFNRKFENNIQLFDTKFSTNILSIVNSVNTLSENIDSVIDNTEIQKAFIRELDKVSYKNIVAENAKLINKIKDIAPILSDFIDRQKDLNTTIDRSAGVVTSIENILNRIKTFEDSINALGENINTKQFLGNEVLRRIDHNLNYLDKQFSLLKDHEDKSSEEIKDFFSKQYGEIQKISGNIKTELKQIVENTEDEVKKAFNLNIENNPFQKLLLLEAIDKHINAINEKINFSGEFNKINNELTSTKSEILDIKNNLRKAIDENRKNITFQRAINSNAQKQTNNAQDHKHPETKTEEIGESNGKEIEKPKGFWGNFLKH